MKISSSTLHPCAPTLMQGAYQDLNIFLSVSCVRAREHDRAILTNVPCQNDKRAPPLARSRGGACIQPLFLNPYRYRGRRPRRLDVNHPAATTRFQVVLYPEACMRRSSPDVSRGRRSAFRTTASGRRRSSWTLRIAAAAGRLAGLGAAERQTGVVMVRRPRRAVSCSCPSPAWQGVAGFGPGSTPIQSPLRTGPPAAGRRRAPAPRCSACAAAGRAGSRPARWHCARSWACPRAGNTWPLPAADRPPG